MRYICTSERQEALAAICSMKCECPAYPEPNSSIGIWDSKENKLVGGVTYTNYTKREIWASIWMDDKKALTKGIMREIYSYPFIKCDVLRLCTNTRAGNEESLKLQKKMGFVEEGRLRRFFGDEPHEDAILMSMLKEECRWIKHG